MDLRKYIYIFYNRLYTVLAFDYTYCIYTPPTSSNRILYEHIFHLFVQLQWLLINREIVTQNYSCPLPEFAQFANSLPRLFEDGSTL